MEKKELIGKKIRALRVGKNISQTEFANHLGVTGKAVSKWENGISSPSALTFNKICGFFGVPFEYFFIESGSNLLHPKSKATGMKSIKSLYRTGIGPSSSHTIGPERICRVYKDLCAGADRFKVVLYGSLAKTGVGHGTDSVIKKTFFPMSAEIEFDYLKNDLFHPNTLKLMSFKNGCLLDERMAYSVGGGDVIIDDVDLPDMGDVYYLHTFSEISKYCKQKKMRLWEYVIETEGEEILKFLNGIWGNMKEAIEKGLKADGFLPGMLKVKRKAKYLFNQTHIDESPETKENRIVCAYAFALGEENASGGQIVTSPTCGSSGVLPAVLLYHQQKRNFTDTQIIQALATAGLIGMLVKTNASVSGAECGCQAEIGTACSMSAAALAELYEMSIDQIEYASEIAIEHHLGLTCDPICGLVQIPCIERNAVAAMRAINAVNLANFLTDTRKISLDLIIDTMYETGKDLLSQYRETSAGGMAKLYGR